jgi:hypothetical protein
MLNISVKSKGIITSCFGLEKGTVLYSFSEILERMELSWKLIHKAVYHTYEAKLHRINNNQLDKKYTESPIICFFIMRHLLDCIFSLNPSSFFLMPIFYIEFSV